MRESGRVEKWKRTYRICRAAEGWLSCAKREKGGMGGGLAHTAECGITSALPSRSKTDERHGVASDTAQDRTKDDGQRTEVW